MGDAAVINYVYPPEYDPTSPAGKHRRYSVLLTSISDGTGESGIAKIDLSGLVDSAGSTPSKVIIEKIVWQTVGMNVKLYFDRTTDVLIASLGIDAGEAHGILDWTRQGGFSDPNSGGTGDVILTTSGHTNGDTYTIQIDFRVS